jgi:hypothetical protein
MKVRRRAKGGGDQPPSYILSGDDMSKCFEMFHFACFFHFEFPDAVVFESEFWYNLMSETVCR